MQKIFAAMAFCAVALSAAPSASAEQGYQSGQVVDFFVKAIELGATRGICVGTPAECSAMAKPAGFDMLINFDLDSADLSPGARNNLIEISRALRDDRLISVAFAIEGHTDATGSESYNMSLSERRAASVRGFLIAEGIDASRLMAVGFGETSSRAADPFDGLNRRVEMRINLP